MKLGGGNLKAHKHSPMAFKLVSFRLPPQFVLSFLEEKQHLSGQRSDLDSKRSLETLLGTNRHQATFDFNQLKPQGCFELD